MPLELTTGTSLGRYELLIQLGRGGMASVWVARERSALGGHQRLVAVKAMLPDLANRQDFRSMFLEEGQIVRSVEHAHVVRVHEVSEDRGVLYMAMDWVEGDSLRAVIREAKRRRAIPPEMAVRMIADTAAGLHAAHELRDWNGELLGIVHCDVSPHNILLGLDGQAKLVDFGVASATTRSDQDRVKGKFGYMSPEQAAGRRFDRRSDIFSLGIVLFELTTGERLFKGRDPNETLQLVMSAAIPRPTEVYAKYPPLLEEIVLKALSRDPDERFQTAEEFRAALTAYFVQERIMVSRASVAQLLKRVLGIRLVEQRERIRAAIKHIDGTVDSDVIPNEAAIPTSQLIVSGEASFTSTESGSPVLSVSRSSIPLQRVTASEPPSGTHSQSLYSGTTRPQVVELRSPPKSSRTFAVLAVLAVLAGAAGVLYAVERQRIDTLLAEQALTGQQKRQGVATPSRPAPVVEPSAETDGVTFDSLPSVNPRRRASRAGAGTRSHETPSSSKSNLAAQAESAAPGREAEVTSPAATEPSQAELEQPKPALPPLEQRAPLNQGAAIAALGTAASSANSCRRSDGPSGAGRANVTFSPDGMVSKVSVSAPFSGTPVGSCVAFIFKRAKIPPYRGGAVTLTRSFVVPQ